LTLAGAKAAKTEMGSRMISSTQGLRDRPRR
jgi:hypothetical protein